MIYGKNDMFAGQPNFIAMATAVLVIPMFVIQVCLHCVLCQYALHTSGIQLWSLSLNSRCHSHVAAAKDI